MENQSQAFKSLETTALELNQQIALKVTGHYQIFEYKKTGTEKKLTALPITVQITQRPGLLALELYNENEGTKTYLNYPMNGASAWSEELQAFLYTRAIGNTLVADIISPVKGQDRSRPTTNRITWRLDDKKCILEFYEFFDAEGKRLDSSPGHLRTLVPVLES